LMIDKLEEENPGIFSEKDYIKHGTNP